MSDDWGDYPYDEDEKVREGLDNNVPPGPDDIPGGQLDSPGPKEQESPPALGYLIGVVIIICFAFAGLVFFKIAHYFGLPWSVAVIFAALPWLVSVFFTLFLTTYIIRSAVRFFGKILRPKRRYLSEAE